MTSPLAGKRVLIVLGCFDLGGAERQAIHVAACLRHRQKAEVEVWAFRPSGRAAELCQQLDIPWRYVPERWGRGPLRWPLMLGRFARTMRQWRPDILLPYTAFPNVICGLSWRLAGAKVCIWNQRDAGLDLASPAVPWAVRSTPLFLSNSQVGAAFLAESLHIDSRRIRVVHNAVQLAPPREDRSAWRTKIGVGPSCILACMIANLQKNKDFATLLRAWRIVVDRLGASDREAILVLAGRLDNTADRVRASIASLGLDASVRLLGEIDDVAGLLAAADLGVFSSVSEGCPNAVLETMAAGLPVVATDCPGVREAIGESDDVGLVPVGNADAMAEQLVRFAADPALRARVGNAHAARIRAAFSLDRLDATMTSLLSAAVDTGRWGEVIPPETA